MKAPVGNVRIIGGRWRGTRLPVPDRPGLRPTSDRVRETLFNWLQPVLPGARVLDLFAGSGALGLEAVSRGAAQATLVERDGQLARCVRDLAARLEGGDVVAVVQANAMAWLHGQADATFDANLWGGVLPALAPKLAAGAWLYVESPIDLAPSPPSDWALHRQGRTREVRYALYQRRVTLAGDSNAESAATA
jgi:16S rRNA (guanine966-N2)-methyltransferase